MPVTPACGCPRHETTDQRLAEASACPLRARSAGQRRELTVTPGQPDTPAHLGTGRLTRCAYRPSKQRVTCSNLAWEAQGSRTGPWDEEGGAGSHMLLPGYSGRVPDSGNLLSCSF